MEVALVIAVIAVAVIAVAAVLYAARRPRAAADAPSAARFAEVRGERDEARSQLESARGQREQAERHLAGARAELKGQSDLLEVLRAERDKALEERDKALEERGEALSEHSQTRSELAAVKADHKARAEELAKARRQIDTHFKGIAADVVKDSAESLLKQAGKQFDSQRKLSDSELEKRQQAIEGLVKPVGETLDRFQKQVGEIEEKREGAYKGLEAQVGLLREETANLRGATGSLSEAMRSSRVRGMWGEQQLRKILELSGMREHISFQTQPVAETDAGRIRPDAVVSVPGGVQVVIDSKAPMDSYLEACNLKGGGADDDRRRAELLDKHAKSLLGHARSLGGREYASGFSGSPDFTVMFVPADPILDVAMDVDPSLWDDAWSRHRVLIATPGLLLAFLRTVALAWQQQSLQDNALEIAGQAKKLYESLRNYAHHVAGVGTSLARAVDAYNRSVGSLETRLLPRARKLEKLGAADSTAGKKKLPSQVTSIPRTARAPELAAGRS